MNGKLYAIKVTLKIGLLYYIWWTKTAAAK